MAAASAPPRRRATNAHTARQPKSISAKKPAPTRMNWIGVGRPNTSPRRIKPIPVVQAHTTAPARSPAGLRVRRTAIQPTAIPIRNGAATAAMPSTASPSEWLVRPSATKPTTAAVSRQIGGDAGAQRAQLAKVGVIRAAAARSPGGDVEIAGAGLGGDRRVRGRAHVGEVEDLAASAHERLQTAHDVVGGSPRVVAAQDLLRNRAGGRQRVLTRQIGRHVVGQPPCRRQRVLGAGGLVHGGRRGEGDHPQRRRVEQALGDVPVLVADDPDIQPGAHDVGRPCGRAARRADVRQQRAVLVGVDEDRHPAVGKASGRPQHPRTVRRHPDLGRALAIRAQPDHGVPQLRKLAVEIDRIRRRPQQADHLDRLDQTGGRPVVRQPVGKDVLRFADPDAEADTAVAHVVKGGERLGDDRRMPPDRVGDPRAEEHARGVGRDRSHQRSGVQEGVR